MEYISDINILEAVLHILDNNADEPILNDYKVELNEDIYKFIYRHIERILKDEEIKYAFFNEQNNIVKQATQDFLNGLNTDIVDVSKDLAKKLFAIMKGNRDIQSCDLLVVSLSTDQGPMLAILKMDYVKNFTHKIDFDENKIGIGIVPQLAGLPASSQRIQKCAFIKPIREDSDLDLMVMDKKPKGKNNSENDMTYFISNFLDCSIVENERDVTKTFFNATETWTRSNITEDADKAEKFRTAIKNKLKEEESIDVEELSEELFNDEPHVKDNFNQFINSQGLSNEIVIDKNWVDKKLKKVKLKVDKDIDLVINEDAYHDPLRFEIQRNGDGSINMVIKNVMNYIEK